MNKLIMALAVCFFASVSFQASGMSANERSWVKQIGSKRFDQGNGISVDSSGSVIVVGCFSDDFVFDASNRFANIGKHDIFVTKFDSTGNMLWLREVGGKENDRALEVDIDGSGNILFIGTIGADPVKFGSEVLSTRGYSDIVIAKYSPDGEPQWAKNFGGNGVDDGTAIAVDQEGNIFATGWFRSRAYFDSLSFLSAGEYDVFVVKLDQEGNVLWVNTAGGELHDYAHAITVDEDGNSYVAGKFHATAIFDHDTLTSAGDTDIFIAKYSSLGDIEWAKRIGGPDRDKALGLTYDSDRDNLVVTGSFTDQVLIESTGQMLQTANANDTDMLLVCMDSNGTIKWARSEGGAGFHQGEKIKTGANGDLFVSGIFSQKMHFGPNALISRGDLDGFLIQYSHDGQPAWISHAGGGAKEDTAFAIAPGMTGNDIFLTGSFSSTAKFRNVTLESRGEDDAFIQRLIEPFETGRLKPTSEPPHYVGHEYTVDLKVGGTKNVYSTTFDLHFTQSEFIRLKEPLSEAIKPGPYIGENGFVIATIDDMEGQVTITARRNRMFIPNDDEVVLATLTFVASRHAEFGLESELHFDNIAAQNDVGEEIFLTPETGRVRLDGVDVWPGDTNNDSFVNEADVLPIGQFFNHNGPERRNRTFLWKKQLAVPWQRFASTFADADGDSVIGLEDVFLIGLHWKKEAGNVMVMSEFAPKANITTSSGTSTLFMQANGLNAGANEIWIEVIADSVQDLFGLAYELTYPISPFINVKNIANGALMGDPIFFTNTDTLNGKISVAMTQKGSAGGVNGSGSVSRILFDLGNYDLEDFLKNLAIVYVSAIDSKGQQISFQIGSDIIITDVADNPDPAAAPGEFVLYANSPNPFNPSTTIRFDLPEKTNLNLTIYDQLGKIVRTLLDEQRRSGRHTIAWDGRDDYGRPVASGAYIYLLKTDRFMKGRRMMLVK
ncbi:MAG: SBBP repeat-containing protein [bacterium]